MQTEYRLGQLLADQNGVAHLRLQSKRTLLSAAGGFSSVVETSQDCMRSCRPLALALALA